MFAYLAESALHPSEEVVVAGPDAVSAMDVIDFKSQLLNLLKVVVERENLGKHWVQVALDHFCPVKLKVNTHTQGFLTLTFLYIFIIIIHRMYDYKSLEIKPLFVCVFRLYHILFTIRSQELGLNDGS